MGFREEFQLKNFGLGHPEPNTFAVSQWSASHSAFIGWRVFWVLWHLAWLGVSIYRNDEETDSPSDSAKWLIYLTNWSYALLVLQSIVHLAVVAFHTKKGHREPGQFGDSTAWYHKVLWINTSVAFNAAILVTVLYWGLVFTELKHVLSIMTHGVTMLYSVMDVFISATPWRLLHAIYPMVYGSAYLIFTVIYHLADGTNQDGEPYIYSALDWAKGGSTVGIAIGTVFAAQPIVHLFLFGLSKLRMYMNESCCGGEGRKVPVSSTNNTDEEQAFGSTPRSPSRSEGAHKEHVQIQEHASGSTPWSTSRSEGAHKEHVEIEMTTS